MSDSLNKYFETTSTSDTKTLYPGDIKVTVDKAKLDFDIAFLIISKEFKNIQKEQLELFSKKMMDYGLGNIALGGNLETDDDINYALQGIQIRLNDKINRLKNLLKNGKSYVEDESIEDTFIDIANYGIIGLLLRRKKWK